jgi:hypothetical protein
VCAQWNYSAAFGILLLFSCQVVDLFMMKTKSVILMDMSCYISEPGYYLVLPFCCDLLGCDVALWAFLSDGPISQGSFYGKKMILSVSLCTTKNT